MLKNQPLRMMADDICKLEIQLLIDFQFAILSDDDLNTVLLEFMMMSVILIQEEPEFLLKTNSSVIAHCSTIPNARSNQRADTSICYEEYQETHTYSYQPIAETLLHKYFEGPDYVTN
jgi:hypothetical protein